MNTQGLFVEVLLSGFFAIACFRSRAESPGILSFAPQRIFGLTDRLERLRRSRWQWFAMVLMLVVARFQMRAPIIAELTVLTQFIVFIALPTHKPAREVFRRG
jgi:hypothetical protein